MSRCFGFLARLPLLLDWLGALLHHVGLTDPTYYTTFFGWARVAGIGAQIVDERSVFRGGKGVPIYRPKYFAEQQTLRHIE